MTPAAGGAALLRRAGVLPHKTLPRRRNSRSAWLIFEFGAPRGMYSAGLDGDIVLFRFNV